MITTRLWSVIEYRNVFIIVEPYQIKATWLSCLSQSLIRRGMGGEATGKRRLRVRVRTQNHPRPPPPHQGGMRALAISRIAAEAEQSFQFSGSRSACSVAILENRQAWIASLLSKKNVDNV
ncbi:hypothetical protein LSTR_LSTR009202 [Laodelphax striatellus]|uniref:Uncharacterized protein n=1 Tax=Laodelphax striatellus TaxID=195883 RepID=A0A482XEC2_LAOST|nr:hypothetical protein LSTR_LSTR009202 [Laodelphax striatellus]